MRILLGYKKGINVDNVLNSITHFTFDLSQFQIKKSILKLPIIMKSKLYIALFAVAVAMSFAFTLINKKERNNENTPVAQHQEPQAGFALEDENQF